VLPDPPSSELVIYLHGIVPPEKTSIQKTNLETVLANAARRARAAALLPRGKQGFAPRGHDGWWGWPTGDSAYRRHAPELLAMISGKREKLERLAGGVFRRVYLAGSSSGAYFVAAVALHGSFPADGFAALSGGSGSVTPELARLSPKPFYIGYGSQDSVGPAARALSELLRRAGWPVKIAAHSVGHGAKEVYLDEAFAFWREHAEPKEGR
jgi:predicted esterase